MSSEIATDFNNQIVEPQDYGYWISNPKSGEEVVMTGLAGKLPESRNIYEFCDNLYNKVDMVTDDERRWNNSHPEFTKSCGKLYDIEKFDAGYFGIHKREADIIDPLVRLFLESAVEAICDAGLNPMDLEGTKTGVFIGSCYGKALNLQYEKDLGREGSIKRVTGCMVANRVGYYLKLKGPTYSVDTNCSSSLFAIEHAFKAIRNGECDKAIVGGVNLCLYPCLTVQLFKLGIISPDSRCKVFDESGNGAGRGEAIIAILLEKSKHAKRIYAQIIHAKTNSDGFKQRGITFPSKETMSVLLEELYTESRIDPTKICFIEAHGTGTKAGDPQETEAIDKIMCKRRQKPLMIGSVKSNIGHTEGASGLSSIIKVIIGMENGFIPPNIHFKIPRQDIDSLMEGRLKVVTENIPFTGDTILVGVNNFGYGGTNGHLLMQCNEKKKINGGLPQDNLPRLVCISGRMESSITTILDDINNRPLDAEYISLYHQIFRRDIQGHLYRGYSILSKSGELTRSLKFIDPNKKHLHLVFTGFLSSWRQIMEQLVFLPLVSASVQRIHNILSQHNIYVMEILLNGNNHCIFNEILAEMAVQIIIADLIKILRIKPTTCFGYGLSNLVCRYFEECLNLEKLVLTFYEIALFCENYENQNFNNNEEDKLSIRNLWYFETKSGFERQLLEKFEKIIPNLKQTTNPCISELEIQNMSEEYFMDAITGSKYHTNGFNCTESIILDIGDGMSSKLKNLINNKLTYCNFEPKIGEDYFLTILKLLGILYEFGYNFEVDKLYPTIKYPVSRGTPMISPLIKWNHKHDWFVPGFQNTKAKALNQEFIKNLSMQDEHWQFANGHVVDGRVLFPITGYLSFVWEAFAYNNSLAVNDMNIVIENFKIFCPTNLTPNTNIDFVIRIQKGCGNFEVLDGEALVANGNIHIPSKSCFEIEIPELENNEDQLLLKQEDIYRELLLRGYVYDGTFRQIMTANLNISNALIQWNGNWIIFIGKIIQLNVLTINTRHLLVPKEIQQISIDFKKHLTYVASFEEEEPHLPVYFYKHLNIIRCGGIEIRGIQAVPVRRRKIRNEPVLESFTFIPNLNHSEMDLSALLRTSIQLSIENLSEIRIKIVELYDKNTWNYEPLSPLIYKILTDTPYIQPTIIILTKEDLQFDNIAIKNTELKSETDCNFVIGINLLQKILILKQILHSLKENGFVLSRESLTFRFSSHKFNSLECLAEFQTRDEKILLLRRKIEFNLPVSIKISNENLNWISKLQEALKKDSNVVIYSQNEPFSGILGLINCIRREPGGDKVRCFFIQDDAPPFDTDHDFYKEQLKKNLVINVYQNSQWGTYRHLLLHEPKTILKEHSYVDTIKSGDLSSLKWIEGSLTSDACLSIEQELIYVYYSVVNSDDANSITCRPNLDLTLGNHKESALGIEFSGQNLLGKRYMGILTERGTLSTLLVANKSLIWEIPDDWSLEDAATIPVPYSVVLYCFSHLHKLRAGETVLIHSGAGDIGQAAIHVAVHYECIVYTTVENEDQRQFLKCHYPQFSDQQISDSKTTSFEQMIYKDTNGHGVDLVLNTLAEDKFLASVRCLAEGGKIFQINQSNSIENNTISMQLLIKNVSFYDITLDKFYNQKQIPLIRTLLNKAIVKGLIKPLGRRVFKNNQLEDAFKSINSYESIGKVLIEVREKIFLNLLPKNTKPQYLCDSNASYVIIGGLGGVGLEFTDWLILRGAKNIILSSRKGLSNGYQSYRIKIWKSYKCQVKISTADVATKKGCKQLIEEANELGPVIAIFNLAGIIKDSLFENQTIENFLITLKPKLLVTKCLDEVSRKLCLKLKDFVVFSSICAGRGSVGVTNYGMANSVMERICEKRYQDGLPAKAIQWGTIDEVGLITQLVNGDHKIDVGGSQPQKLSSCFNVLDTLLLNPDTVVSSTVVAEKQEKSSNLKNIGEAIAQIFGIKDLKTISFETTLPELGMDSMTATEINQMLKNDFNILMTLTELRSMTLAKLVEIQKNISLEKHSDESSKTSNVLNKCLKDENNNILEKFDSKSIPKAIILPDIAGEATTLDVLIQNLDIKGLVIEYPFDSLENGIEDLVKNILPYVEENVSKAGQFHLVAYSFGVVLAIELAYILEMKGYEGRITCIDGSPIMLKEFIKSIVDLKNEDNFQTSLLCKILINFVSEELVVANQDFILKCNNYEERLDYVAKMFSRNCINDFDCYKSSAIYLYKRLNYLIDYKPKFSKLLKSKLTLLKPEEQNVIGLKDDYNLSDLCENPVKVKKFKGDHKTILENWELAKTIDNLVDEDKSFAKVDRNNNNNLFDEFIVKKIR